MAAIAALAGLGGCDQIVTRGPMFGPQDIAVAQLKPGVWRVAPPTCARRDAATAGPSACGTEMTVDASSLRPTKATAARGEAENLAGVKMTYVLASGDPQLVQLSLSASSQPQGGRTMSMVTYAALKPVELGPDGQIVRAELWGILCGPRPATASLSDGIDDSPAAMAQQPPPEPETEGGGAADPRATDDLLAGSDAPGAAEEPGPLETPSGSETDDDDTPPPMLRGQPFKRIYFPGMKAAGVGCTPSNPDALRDAAAQSRTDARETMTLTWVREPEG